MMVFRVIWAKWLISGVTGQPGTDGNNGQDGFPMEMTDQPGEDGTQRVQAESRDTGRSRMITDDMAIQGDLNKQGYSWR